MHLNIMALAIPLFSGFILLEYFITKKKGLAYFNLHNSIANISIGIAERLADILVAGFFYFIYDNLQKKYGLFHIKPGFFAGYCCLFLLILSGIGTTAWRMKSIFCGWRM